MASLSSCAQSAAASSMLSSPFCACASVSPHWQICSLPGFCFVWSSTSNFLFLASRKMSTSRFSRGGMTPCTGLTLYVSGCVVFILKPSQSSVLLRSSRAAHFVAPWWMRMKSGSSEVALVRFRLMYARFLRTRLSRKFARSPCEIDDGTATADPPRLRAAGTAGAAGAAVRSVISSALRSSLSATAFCWLSSSGCDDFVGTALSAPLEHEAPMLPR
mmetsp:Transcript_36109/g.113384  ORF Transcript_36109/g.113384 Transcript_36109/m.113384 type:complete len:217 (+) Transcript_36109:920-1570(+)